MTKTLVIQGVDFSTNALDTVIIDSPIPCTGITIDQASLDISYGSSGVLVATPTPADTTDSIVWSSTDTSVATVSNGTVTAIGVGSATITAQCGSYSATCSVIVTLAWTKVLGARLAGVTTRSGGGGAGYFDTGSRYGSLASSVGTLKIESTSSDTNTYYPYKIPDGIKRIKISKDATANIEIYRIQFYSTTVPSTTISSRAQLVDMNESATFTDNVFIGDIPQYDGYPTIDGIAISLALPNGTFAENDFDNVTIEFLPATE